MADATAGGAPILFEASSSQWLGSMPHPQKRRKSDEPSRGLLTGVDGILGPNINDIQTLEG